MLQKVLYFEGAGWSKSERAGAIGNCRIRTAFTIKNGKKIYFEASAWMPNNEQRYYYNHNPENVEKMQPGKTYAAITSLHYITDEKDANGYNISDEKVHNIERKYYKKLIEWSPESLLAFVRSLGGCFSAVKCLDNLASYRVHKDKPNYKNGNTNNYNYGDEFDYNAQQTERRIAKYNEIYKAEQAKGEKFPNFSFYVDPLDSDYCVKCINNGKYENGERYIKYYIPAEVI